MIDGNRRAAWHYAQQILGQQLTPFVDLVQRLGASLVTEEDVRLFGQFLTAIHNAGHALALEQYREQLRKLGYAVTVVERPAAEARPGDRPR